MKASNKNIFNYFIYVIFSGVNWEGTNFYIIDYKNVTKIAVVSDPKVQTETKKALNSTHLGRIAYNSHWIFLVLTHTKAAAQKAQSERFVAGFQKLWYISRVGRA